MTATETIPASRRSPLLRDGGWLREGVARRHGRRRNWARMRPRTTPTNTAHHHPQAWCEKVDGSIKGSDTPQTAKFVAKPKQEQGLEPASIPPVAPRAGPTIRLNARVSVHRRRQPLVNVALLAIDELSPVHEGLAAPSTMLQACDDSAASGAGTPSFTRGAVGPGRVLTRFGVALRSALDETRERRRTAPTRLHRHQRTAVSAAWLEPRGRGFGSPRPT